MDKAYLGAVDKSFLDNKSVLVRADFNVDLTAGEGGSWDILSDARIRDSLETIQYLVEANAKVILVSHLGRPGGKPDPRFSLKPVAARLQNLLGAVPFQFVEDCVGGAVDQAKQAMTRGQVLLLENLRFHKEEEENDSHFAEQLASGIDIYVNEAFSASHRVHASTHGISQFVEQRYAGFSLHKEMAVLLEAVTSPHRPVAAVIGGLKVSTKIDLLNSLLDKVDKILIGGAMAFTFYKALGQKVGDSFVERSAINTANEIIQKAAEKDVTLRFATDFTVIPTRAFQAKLAKRKLHDQSVIPDLEYCMRNVKFDDIPEHWTGVDIGPETIVDFNVELQSCHSIIVNGPMGMFEDPEYSHGTHEMLKLLEHRTLMGSTTLVCGGETVAATDKFGCKNFTHISMGGAAALMVLSGQELPGVSVLNQAKDGK